MELTRPTQPAESQQGEVTAVLSTFQPVEAGWVMSTPAESGGFHVWPIVGWALYDLTDGQEEWSDVRPISNYLDTTYHSDAYPRVYFSRKLFREAQSGSALVLSRAQLEAEVSE